MEGKSLRFWQLKPVYSLLILALFLGVGGKIFAQAASTSSAKSNKLGISVVDIPTAKVQVESNYQTGTGVSKNFNMPGVDIYYEKFYDDFFSYGFHLTSFVPPKLTLTVPYSTLDDVISRSSTPYEDEKYTLKLTTSSAGFYIKTYIKPVKNAGLKPYMSVGLDYVSNSIQLTRDPNDLDPQTETQTLTTNFLMYNASFGADYVLKNGLGVRMAARYLWGFGNKSFTLPENTPAGLGPAQTDPASQNNKNITLYINKTVLLDLGVFFFF